MVKRKQIDEVFERIRAVGAAIPGLTMPRSRRDRESLVRKATLPPELLTAAVAAVEGSERIAAACALDAGHGRAVLERIIEYDVIASELEQLARAVRHTSDVERATLGGLALQVYAAAKTLAPEDGHAAAHADAMRVILRKRKRKARVKK